MLLLYLIPWNWKNMLSQLGQSPLPRKSTTLKFVVIAVVIVLVVVIAGISASIYVNDHHSTHIAVVPASVVTSLAKEQFTKAYDNASAMSTFNVTKGEVVYFNVTSLGSIIVASLEFTSSSSSLSFFNEEYQSALRIFDLPSNAYNISNGSYNGFNYFVLTQNDSKTVKGTTIISIGYSGSYQFSIALTHLTTISSAFPFLIKYSSPKPTSNHLKNCLQGCDIIPFDSAMSSAVAKYALNI